MDCIVFVEDSDKLVSMPVAKNMRVGDAWQEIHLRPCISATDEPLKEGLWVRVKEPFESYFTFGVLLNRLNTT